ncbi:DUF637 domain-containing protein [Propionispira raffinosivorans]|uniref:DUF637 domain-containing protein n=1 Tax=Propionispira raffinosivorans TaxID=86959 RepID=UPI0003621F89|nr:DUF637 domain-containing protein [Propionispira raffinosivorans]
MSYSDIKNKADYNSSSIGVNVNTSKDAKYNEKGITPNIGVPASGNADSTTKSAIALGTIEIRSNHNQDISNLSRNTDQVVNALGKIFDKKSVQEKQELAGLFGQLAFEEVHKIGKANGWDEGSPQKIALHALVGGIMSDLGGSGVASGAVGARVNEAIQKELSKITDPDVHQWVSALVGATASKIVGGNAQTGASTAVSGTKNNNLAETVARCAIRLEIIPDPQTMKNDYVFVQVGGGIFKFISGSVGSIMDRDGNIYTFAQGDLGAGWAPPVSGSAGFGNVDTNWKESGNSILDAIEGDSYGGGGTSLVGASVSRATNGAITVEVSITTSVGTTLVCKRTAWLAGNIYND